MTWAAEEDSAGENNPGGTPIPSPVVAVKPTCSTETAGPSTIDIRVRRDSRKIPVATPKQPPPSTSPTSPRLFQIVGTKSKFQLKAICRPMNPPAPWSSLRRSPPWFSILFPSFPWSSSIFVLPPRGPPCFSPPLRPSPSPTDCGCRGPLMRQPQSVGEGDPVDLKIVEIQMTKTPSSSMFVLPPRGPPCFSLPARPSPWKHQIFKFTRGYCTAQNTRPLIHADIWTRVR